MPFFIDLISAVYLADDFVLNGYNVLSFHILVLSLISFVVDRSLNGNAPVCLAVTVVVSNDEGAVRNLDGSFRVRADCGVLVEEPGVKIVNTNRALNVILKLGACGSGLICSDLFKRFKRDSSVLECLDSFLSGSLGENIMYATSLVSDSSRDLVLLSI